MEKRYKKNNYIQSKDMLLKSLKYVIINEKNLLLCDYLFIM
jgi:hypothetical protein